MKLKNFREALERYRADISETTYWRYQQIEQLPKQIKFIFERPYLALALAMDAQKNSIDEERKKNTEELNKLESQEFYSPGR
jgi:uncharacterized protein YcgL (UPF0745 family)